MKNLKDNYLAIEKTLWYCVVEKYRLDVRIWQEEITARAVLPNEKTADGKVDIIQARSKTVSECEKCACQNQSRMQGKARQSDS